MCAAALCTLVAIENVVCSALVGSDFSGGYLSESRKLDMTHAAYKSVATHIQDLAGGLVS